MNKQSLLKRLATLKDALKNVPRKVNVIYEDGRQENMKIVEVASLIIYHPDTHGVKEVYFIGDTSKDGILPELIKYFLKK